MKITIKSGQRGRPLTIDTENLLRTVNKNLTEAKRTLSQIRKTTSGYRGVEILGSETQLPDWLEKTFSLIDMAKSGITIDYATAKELKAGVETVKQLAGRNISKEKALSSYFEKDFLKMIDEAMFMRSGFTKEQFRQMERIFQKMTPAQKQSFMLSQGYQDIKTLSQKYEKIKAWAEKNNDGKKMTYYESDAYLLRRRMEDGLSTDFITKDTTHRFRD